MAQEVEERPAEKEGMPASAIFTLEHLLKADGRAAVVSRVLHEFPNLPHPVRQSLRSAVNDEVIPTSGSFRRGQAGRALEGMPTILQEPMESGICFSDKLASAVLRCWVESHPSLREKAEEFLGEREIPVCQLDKNWKSFSGTWLLERLHTEREAFCRDNEEFSPDDAALMLCCLSGNFPFQPDPQTEAMEVDQVLSDFLDSLRGIPADSPVWKDVIPNFAASVSGLVDEKGAQLRWASDFDAVLQSLNGDHAELLAFFEHQDTQQWSAARVSRQADTAAALRMAQELGSTLAEYAAVHDVAPGITEERERSRKRAALQTSVLERLSAMAALMTEDPDEASDDESASLDANGIPTIRGISASPNPDSSSLPRAVSHSAPDGGLPQAGSLPAGQRADINAAADSAPENLETVALAEYQALQSENDNLLEITQALRSEMADLREELEAVKTERHSSEEVAESWRLAYRSLLNGPEQEAEEGQADVESVNAAVELARNRYKQELLFAPNSESNIEDNPFVDPGKVWEALRWLADTYYASKMGRLRVTDFDQSIKEACGWWYKGDQGETTVSKFEKSYTTRVDGKRYTLVEHIGKGTTFDARYTIRIAFDWDREKRQVIVGYIGRHQQTSAS